MASLSVNAQRLWNAHMRMAEIGATPEGGSNRPALSAEDAEARALLRRWCAELGLTEERDALANSFYRRPGTNPAARAVAFGSHLDTVPTGGRFDGVSGVLAGLEVLRTLHEAGRPTRAPLELVNWTNEEGTRFRPAMMGSRVHAGDMPLAQALATAEAEYRQVGQQALADANERASTHADPKGPEDEKIIRVLEEYIRPAVESDGGHIAFKSFDEGIVTVSLRGSCSGCPSSMVTLKSGVENLLKQMVPGVREVVAVEL